MIFNSNKSHSMIDNSQSILVDGSLNWLETLNDFLLRVFYIRRGRHVATNLRNFIFSGHDPINRSDVIFRGHISTNIITLALYKASKFVELCFLLFCHRVILAGWDKLAIIDK